MDISCAYWGCQRWKNSSFQAVTLFFKWRRSIKTIISDLLLQNRYSKDELPKNPAPTIGVEFGTKIVQLKDGTKVKAQIWDTGNIK